MTNLKVFTSDDGIDKVVATDQQDAQAAWQEHGLVYFGEWHEASPDEWLTIFYPDNDIPNTRPFYSSLGPASTSFDEGWEVEATMEAWAKWNGRGYLCSGGGDGK